MHGQFLLRISPEKNTTNAIKKLVKENRKKTGPIEVKKFIIKHFGIFFKK